jgi:hypothetical protein
MHDFSSLQKMLAMAFVCILLVLEDVGVILQRASLRDFSLIVKQGEDKDWGSCSSHKIKIIQVI